MLFYIFFFTYLICIVFKDDIRLYFWNKKSPEEKYKLWRKARADYNHKNGIVDELQYDYMKYLTTSSNKF